jgi:hypothetical protein
MLHRQGLKRQLVAAGEFDGWLAGATGGSSLPDTTGKGTRKTTKAESPAACQKKNYLLLLQHFSTFQSQMN